MFERILVVCTGNICRSPMAAALLGHNLASHNPAVEVQSAGLAALVGYPADSLAQELLWERGIDLSDHRARQLTAAMIMDADLVLAMETAQVKMVSTWTPAAPTAQSFSPTWASSRWRVKPFRKSAGY